MPSFLAWTAEQYGGSTHPNFEFDNLLNKLQSDVQCELIQLSAGGEPSCEKRKEDTHSN